MSKWCRFLFTQFTLILAILGCFVGEGVADESEEPAASAKHVLIVIGPSSHPPGTHEVGAGGRLLAYCLEQAELSHDFKVTISEGWPDDKSLLQTADCVVFSGDRFPLAEMDNTQQNMQEMAEMMNRGCGLVCFHYATGLTTGQVAEDGAHPLLEWMGGYFATRCPHHQSVARIFREANIQPTSEPHPVVQGCKPFTIHDEPYIKNYFGPNGMRENVTALATAMLPPEKPQKEVVAWAVERADGGRGMGIVMPHFYKNWSVDDLRKMILNGVVWAAQAEVPQGGVAVELPSLEQFMPGAIEPRRR